MRNRIICIGNRFIDNDCSGALVFDILQKKSLPANTDLIDGGTCGLNLLGRLENVERVIFVDTIEGFLSEGGVAVIENPADSLQSPQEIGHGAGLAYLLCAASAIVEGPLPSIALVGIEQPKKQYVEEAAERCLQLLW